MTFIVCVGQAIGAVDSMIFLLILFLQQKVKEKKRAKEIKNLTRIEMEKKRKEMSLSSVLAKIPSRSFIPKKKIKIDVHIL